MKGSLLLWCLFVCVSLHAQTKDTLLPKVFHWLPLKPLKEGSNMQRPVLAGRTLALQQLEAKAVTVAPGAQVKPPHPMHTNSNEDELLIVKQGKVKITLNGEQQMLEPGSIAFFMRGDAHSIENGGDADATWYVFSYKGRQSIDTARGSFVLNINDLKTSNTGKGYRRDYFNRATSQIKQFEMHTTALNAGEISHPPHTHVQEEVILVIRGHVKMQLGDRKEEGKYGDVFFVSSNVPHNLTNIGEEQCEYFAFQWRN